MSTEFPVQPRRDDPHGHMTVWSMLLFLRDTFDKAIGKIVRGSAVVASTATTVVVNTGISAAAYSVQITPTVDPGGRYWVSNKTTTTFQINLSVAAPVGGVGFDWIVRS